MSEFELLLGTKISFSVFIKAFKSGSKMCYGGKLIIRGLERASTVPSRSTVTLHHAFDPLLRRLMAHKLSFSLPDRTKAVLGERPASHSGGCGSRRHCATILKSLISSTSNPGWQTIISINLALVLKSSAKYGCDFKLACQIIP
jgi:hypothetical protein